MAVGAIGVQFETDLNPTAGDAIIINNHFKNTAIAVEVLMGHSTNEGFHNLYFHNNLLENMGYADGSFGGFMMYLAMDNGTGIDSIFIDNNTMIGGLSPGNAKFALFIECNTAHIKNVYFRNNIAENIAAYGYITFRGSVAADNIYSQNNITYLNSNTNNPYYITGTPTATHFTNSGNIITNPVLDGIYHLTSSSPAIGACINLGYGTDIGAFPYNTTNILPVANAGPDQTIALPVDSVTQLGIGTDANGTITSYNWTKISGPSTYNIVNPTSPGTSVTGLGQGVYQFQLKVIDNNSATGTDTMQVTVNALPNQPPAANAGLDQTITMPTNSVTLSGSGSDPDGTISSYKWTEISGPSSYTIVNANSAGTSVTSLVQGVYQFQLTVTDNNGATGTDVILITVNAAANIAPIANAGLDQTITLPVNSVTLSGSGSDADGTVVSYVWTEISGPSGYNIVNSNSPVTDVAGLVQGVYQFQLTVTDNSGAIGTDIIQVTVNAAVNIPPTANAGLDQTITLPTNSVTLSGSGSDADGTVVDRKSVV